MPKYLVIGSNSFSGQDFIDYLLDQPDAMVTGTSRSDAYSDYRLRFTSNPNLDRYRFVRFDMNRDMDALLAFLEEERPEYIVNFAAQSEVGPSWEYPEHWFQTNTVALARLINHLRKQNWLQRYLHISSPEAYGNCVGTVTEETPDNPSTPYAASKSAADMLVSVYQRTYGLPAVFVRATNVYGARQQLFKIIPRAAIYFKLGRKLRLDGGGVAVKSYINVRDVSAGEFEILHKGDIGELYHLSPDGGIAIRELVRLIAERMGKRCDEVTETGPDRPGQDAAYVIDSSKARDRFGWRPEIGIEEGISEVVEWVEENWSKIKDEPLDYLHKA